MASPQDEPMDLGDALVSAASCLPPDPILPTPEVCHTMCEIILAGFQYSFVVNPQTLWTYFGLRLKKAREYHVGRATRLLLGCGAFMAHAVGADVRIRPVLVAGVMLHLPAEVGYLFIIRACFYPVHVIYEASQFALDPAMLKNAEGTTIVIMERVISFLKTEKARGTKALVMARLTQVEMNLKSPSIRNAMGMAIIDYILGHKKLDMVFEADAMLQKGTILA